MSVFILLIVILVIVCSILFFSRFNNVLKVYNSCEECYKRYEGAKGAFLWLCSLLYSFQDFINNCNSNCGCFKDVLVNSISDNFSADGAPLVPLSIVFVILLVYGFLNFCDPPFFNRFREELSHSSSNLSSHRLELHVLFIIIYMGVLGVYTTFSGLPPCPGSITMFCGFLPAFIGLFSRSWWVIYNYHFNLNKMRVWSAEGLKICWIFFWKQIGLLMICFTLGLLSLICIVFSGIFLQVLLEGTIIYYYDGGLLSPLFWLFSVSLVSCNWVVLWFLISPHSPHILIVGLIVSDDPLVG